MTKKEKINEIRKSFLSNFMKLDRIMKTITKENDFDELIALIRLYNFFNDKSHSFEKKLSKF